jgi:hypothetical protein
MTLVELAHLALALAGEGVERRLLQRLRNVQRSQVEEVVADGPGIVGDDGYVHPGAVGRQPEEAAS